MRIIEFALLLGAALGLLVFALRGVAGGRRRRGPALWRPETHGLPSGGWTVTVECEGEPAQEVARVGPHEHERLLDYEAEAEALADTLNAGRRRRQRLSR